MSALLAIMPTAAVALTVGGAALGARVRERHADPRRPAAVVDPRTYRAAVRQIERLQLLQDERAPLYAHAAAAAITVWLHQEVHTGPRRHRLRRARELEYWEMRREDLHQAAATEDEGDRR